MISKGCIHECPHFREYWLKKNTGELTIRGYTQNQFIDAFGRYLPPVTPITPIQTATVLQPTPVKDLLDFQSVTQENNVTVAKQREATPVKDCNVVAVETTSPPGKKKYLKTMEVVE